MAGCCVCGIWNLIQACWFSFLMSWTEDFYKFSSLKKETNLSFVLTWIKAIATVELSNWTEKYGQTRIGERFIDQASKFRFLLPLSNAYHWILEVLGLNFKKRERSLITTNMRESFACALPWLEAFKAANIEDFLGEVVTMLAALQLELSNWTNHRHAFVVCNYKAAY